MTQIIFLLLFFTNPTYPYISGLNLSCLHHLPLVSICTYKQPKMLFLPTKKQQFPDLRSVALQVFMLFNNFNLLMCQASNQATFQMPATDSQRGLRGKEHTVTWKLLQGQWLMCSRGGFSLRIIVGWSVHHRLHYYNCTINLINQAYWSFKSLWEDE